MLSQNDLLGILLKELNTEQHHVFNMLHAYVYSKASRGNLPSEVLGKVLSIQRKLLLKRGPAAMNIARQRAFDAMKTLLLTANRRWLELGPRAWGALGQIGTASNVDARWCWTKATDGKIKDFPDGGADGGRGMMNSAVPILDAGRVVDPRYGYADVGEGLPQYMPPTPPTAPTNGTAVTSDGPMGDARATQEAEEALGYSRDRNEDARFAADMASDRAELSQRREELEAAAAAAAAVAQDGSRSSFDNPNHISPNHPDGTAKTKEELDLERGKQALARMREERMRKEQEEEERRNRQTTDSGVH